MADIAASPDTATAQPGGYDLAGARAAGVSDRATSDFLATVHPGYDLAAARRAGVPDSATADFLAAQAPPPPPPPETTATGAFLHAAGEQVAPTLGGMAAAGTGAELGGAAGAVVGGPIGATVGGVAGGLGGFLLGAKAMEGVQQSIIENLPESVQRAIGEAPEQRAAAAAQHPYATMAGGLAPSLLVLRPGAVEEAAENAPAIMKFMANPITARTFGAGVNTSLEALQEEQQGEGIDPTKLAIAAGAGALLTRETALGKTLSGEGAALVPGLLRPRPAVAAVLDADSVDAAVDAAAKIASSAEPINIEEHAAGLDETDPQQAKLLRMIQGALPNAPIEQLSDGSYALRTRAGEAVPLKVWNPDEEPVGSQAAIPHETAQAIRDHYAAAGVDTVFYHDIPNAPFDGVMDPDQPDTVFISNNPQRAVAQVAGHEFTHVLADTRLPDGTSLGDVLNQQIAATITPEGQAYAEQIFGATAPKRAAFPAGTEGDAAHAAAVQAHLVNELGAEIGAEAPRFQTFLPRVVDAIQQRFGDSVAGDVLTKLVNGLRSAVETIRGLFGDHATESQNWVANIGDIHDTLARMYAERFATPVEREQAALARMKEQAALARGEIAPAPAVQAVSEPPLATLVPGTRSIEQIQREENVSPHAAAQVQLTEATAARDQAGRGALTATGTQKPADEGLFAPKDKQRPLFSPREDDRVPLHSALQRGVDALKLDRAPPGQWLSTIRNMPGVKAEEARRSGIEDWLKQQPKPVTRAEVADYLRANSLDVREVGYGERREDVVPDAQAIANHNTEWTQLDEKTEALLGPFRQTRDPVEKSRIRDAIMDLTAQRATLRDRMIDETMQRQVNSGKPTKFSQQQLPGGKNYRELLITLPGKADELSREIRGIQSRLPYAPPAEQPAMLAREQQLLEAKRTQPDFRGSHWNEPNVLAHVRFSERDGADGKRTLLVDEVQSDWHQKGRKEGYQLPASAWTPADAERLEYLVANARTVDEMRELEELREKGGKIQYKLGIPDAPFKTTWPALVMKRVIKYAVDNGFDRIAWTSGEVQAERYDLSKKIKALHYDKTANGEYLLAPETHTGREAPINNGLAIPENKLADYVGKEIAEKIVRGEGEGSAAGVKTLSGLDLKVGGEGMRAFYDKMLPAEVNKIAGKFGAKVGESRLQERDQTIANNSPAHAAALGVMPVHSLDINPAMKRAVATEGLPLFSPRITGADRETEAYTPEQIAAYTRVGRITDEPGWRERLTRLTNDLGRRVLRYTLDPYIGVKRDDPAGYMALRNANTTSGAALMFMTDGTLKFSGSTYAMKNRNGGVIHTLVQPLQGEQDRFLWWVAAHRAEKLTAEDRENLWSAEDIAAIKGTNRGRAAFDYTMPDGTVTRSREAIYADSLRKLDAFNRNVMDLAVESGLLNRGRISAMLANPFYVPFYRQAEGDAHFVGPSITSGMVKQYAFKALKGGTDRLNHDLWQNAIGNWTHMIDASLRNRAATGVLDTAVTNGAARELTTQEYDHQLTKREKESAVWAMKDGNKQYYAVDDPLLYTAITALDFSGFHNPIMRAMGAFKKWLTVGVTANPLFMLRVAIRDAEQVIATAPASYNVLGNITRGFQMGDLPGALQNVARAVAGSELERRQLSNQAADVIAGGGTMHLGSGTETGQRTDLATMLNNPNAIAAFWNRISTIAHAYKELTSLGEDVHRFALYDKLVNEGMPHDAAAFAARDLEDFTLRGAGTIVRGLTQMVPFMNAWAQGLYKVGRSAFDADRGISAAVGGRLAVSATRRVMTVLGATALLTLALDAIYKDDEDYKKRPEYDRNSNFWFKFGDTQFRIPMGFEVAALARIAANGVEAFTGQNEMTARRFLNNVGSIFATNMSMNPTPQIVKPILDVAMNQTGTGSPIVPKGMETLRPEYQYNANTTLLARAISSVGSQAVRAIGGPTAGFISPMQIDYLTNGYFGWLGSMITGVADRAAREFAPASVAPARPAMDLWNFATGGMIATQPTQASRYVDLLYQQGAAINLAFDTYSALLHSGRIPEAKTFLQENKALIVKHPLIAAAERFEAEENQMARRIEYDPNRTPEQKRVALMALNAARNRMAERVFGGANAP